MFPVTLPSKDGEITSSLQKKETSFFVMRPTFRNFALKYCKKQTNE